MAMAQYSFTATELAIKAERSDPNIDILALYVHSGLERAKQCGSASSTKAAHMRLVTTLQEVICDDCLSLQWRVSCHQWIKRLLPLLHELMTQQEYQQKVQEIKTQFAYFLANKRPLAGRDDR